LIPGIRLIRHRGVTRMNTETSKPDTPADLTDQPTKKDAQELVIKALEQRPKFSIKMQIYFSFLLAFVLTFGVVTAHLIGIYDMENQIHFLEISNSYLFQIQQVRRFEKNFFMHGTNLDDALESLGEAKKILTTNSLRWGTMMSGDSINVILPHLQNYEKLLLELSSLSGDRRSGEYLDKLSASEEKIRIYGRVLLNFAENIMEREIVYLESMILTTRWVHILSFVFLLMYIVFMIYFLGLRILRPINRFLKYTQRIAEGDFSPIGPKRRYRDEFSILAIGINRMVAELDRRQNILIASHKLRAIGTLTSGVAHELNNPINNITITSHMLLEDMDDLSDDDMKDMVNDIIKEAARSKQIVKNLLDFARESESIVQTIDIGEVLNETLRLAGNQIKVKGVQVDTRIMPGLSRIYGDKQQLTQVFLNLIINALDVTEKNGDLRILILPSSDPSFVEVKVIDFGSGIPDHILPSIFDPFFTTKSKRGGTGLGLSVSQGIIAKFGGRLDVDTEVGKGTTFTVSLPVATFPADLESVK